MRPYLLWAGDNYYPGSALTDYKGDFETLEEAEAEGCRRYAPTSRHWKAGQPVYDWYSIVKHATMTEVCYGWNGERSGYADV